MRHSRRAPDSLPDWTTGRCQRELRHHTCFARCKQVCGEPALVRLERSHAGLRAGPYSDARCPKQCGSDYERRQPASEAAARSVEATVVVVVQDTALAAERLGQRSGAQVPLVHDVVLSLSQPQLLVATIERRGECLADVLAALLW